MVISLYGKIEWLQTLEVCFEIATSAFFFTCLGTGPVP